jgi:hypothetical protein
MTGKHVDRVSTLCFARQNFLNGPQWL